MIVNKRELADILGVAEDTLTQWQRDQNFPVKSKSRGQRGNEYETSDIVAWLRKREVDNLVGNSNLIDIEEAKRRKIAAEAGLVELELAKEKGEVAIIAEVADEFGEQLSALRAKLLSLPSKTAGMVFTAKDVAEAKDILENAILESLNELVGYRQSETERGVAASLSQDITREAETTAQADSKFLG